MRRLPLLILALPVSLAAQSPRATLVRRLDSLTRAWVAAGGAPGVSVAVVRGSDTLLLEGVGERDMATHAPATATTVYRVGSITKQFTAALVMQLVEAGRMGLDDPLSRWLPQYPRWGAVTIRQLLDHTSGIRNFTDDDEWARHVDEPMTPARILSFVTDDSADFTPGRGWRYDNSGYILLGLVLERATGRPFAGELARRFFAPLGMRSAMVCPGNPGAHGARGYNRMHAGLQPAPYASLDAFSAGSLCMSAGDLLRWQRALADGRVVSRASLALMTESDTLPDGTRTGYGFGLATGELGGRRMVVHGGSIPGFMTSAAWFPDDSLFVIVLPNARPTGAEELMTNLALAALGEPALPLQTWHGPYYRPAPNATMYLGRYTLRDAGGRVVPMRIDSTAAGLSARIGSGPAFLIDYTGDDSFGSPFEPAARIHLLVENGRATRARVVSRGTMLQGPRVP